MPNTLPHIYAAFANDSRTSLQLAQEKKGLEDYFLPLESRSMLNLVLRDPVNLASLSTDFINFEHRIEVLHFSGHASTKSLYFELLGGETQAANALGLVSLIAKQRSLKLLLLNACSTLQQGERIQETFRKQYEELPAPAIICTRRPVNDTAACLFSQHFYLAFTEGRSVQEAFSHAESLVNAHFGTGAYRDLYFEGAEADGGQLFPWVLLPGGRGGWALASEEKGQTLGERHQYMCNREPQETSFQANYYQKQSKIADFYVLHGPEKQAHGSLPKRFRHEFMEDEKAEVLRVQLKESDSLDAYKSDILLTLFKELERERPKCGLHELTFARLRKSAQNLGYQEVLVNVQVESASWKPFTPDLLRWFAEEFCQDDTGTHPRFLFFLSVVYTQAEAPKQGFFGKFFSKPKDPNEALEAALLQLPFTSLDKLAPVKPRDIERWVELCGISDYKTHQEKVRRAYFEEKEQYDMEEVELTLKKIINDFNQKAKRLTDLLD